MVFPSPCCELLVIFRNLKSSYQLQVLGSGFYFKGLQVSDGNKGSLIFLGKSNSLYLIFTKDPDFSTKHLKFLFRWALVKCRLWQFVTPKKGDWVRGKYLPKWRCSSFFNRKYLVSKSGETTTDKSNNIWVSSEPVNTTHLPTGVWTHTFKIYN